MAIGSDQTYPRVSVIIPTYNRADYLREALASVLDQSLQPWEIIVVDDGSTDDTPELARSFPPNVVYIRQPQNMGVSAARNAGLSAARGEVIAWLDSDDLWEPGFLATVIPLLAEDERLDGVYTGLTRIDGAGAILPQQSQWSVPPEELRSSLVESCSIQTSTFVARKRCFDQAGEFDTRFGICEDYDMFVRIAQNCRIMGVPRPLVRYRVHMANTVSDPVAFCEYRLALTEKHYGSHDGDPVTWSDEKRRAYGFAYRALTLKCLEQRQTEKGWQYFHQAVATYPELLERTDTFYELACGDQPAGLRGAAHLLDIRANGAEMLRRLDELFSSAEPPVQQRRGIALGNAYLALGMLSDQAGRWPEARRYVARAIRANPKLLRSQSVVRRLLKLCVGRRMVDAARGLVHSGADTL